MRVHGLDLSKIPPSSVLRSDADVRTFLAQNHRAILDSGRQWVRETSTDGLKLVLDAGNPRVYFMTIDGVTSRIGNVRRGFKTGTINEAQHAVRVEFNADNLGTIARAVMPILAGVILKVFPRSKTKRLSRDWSWWLQLPGQNSKRIGKSVPENLPLESILYLAPDFYPAKYAYVANVNASRGIGPRIKAVTDRRESRKQKRLVLKFKRNSVSGYLARATRQMRGRRAPGVLFQGGNSQKYLTGRAARPGKERNSGVPFIRVRFKALAKAVNV